MASSESDNPRSKMIAAPGRCAAWAGELAQNAKAPHTGKLSKRPEGPPGFSIAQESLRRCSANQLRRLGFTPPGSALPGRAPSTYHGLGNRLWQRGHFYFAGEGTFLLCLDTYSFLLDAPPRPCYICGKPVA